MSDDPRILVVEDSAADAKLMQTTLNRAFGNQITIVLATRADEAIQILLKASTRFDVILLDLTLPDSAGVDTVRHIKPYAGTVPIVVMTSGDDLSSIVKLHGAEQFISKIDYVAIADLIVHTIRSRHRDHTAYKTLSERLQAVAVGIADLQVDSRSQGVSIEHLATEVHAITEATAKIAAKRETDHARLTALEAWRDGLLKRMRWVVACVVTSAIAAFFARLLGVTPE